MKTNFIESNTKLTVGRICSWSTADGITIVEIVRVEDQHALVRDTRDGSTWYAHRTQLL